MVFTQELKTLRKLLACANFAGLFRILVTISCHVPIEDLSTKGVGRY